MYYKIWKNCNRFFLRLAAKPSNWEDRLTLYVGYIISENRKSTTIRSYISAIKAVLQNGGVRLKQDEVLLASLTRACGLKNDTIQMKLPIGKGLLGILVKAVPRIFETEQQFLVILYRAIMLTAYYGLFHIGELTYSQHVVKAQDVHIGQNKNKLMFILHSSKTHNKGDKPQIIKITSQVVKNITVMAANKNNWKHNYWCPFKALKDYLTIRSTYSDANEQFFSFLEMGHR